MTKIDFCPKCKIGSFIKHKGLVFCCTCGFEKPRGRRKKCLVTDGKVTLDVRS
ncbi:hypothetical protein ACFL6S_00705 [Candidatus Poribacteria bacterium]